MTANFPAFSKAVHQRYHELSQGELYVVEVGDIFANYLAAFPEGTNPIFRQRTEHDCNCCKQFIRRLGVCVSINGVGGVETVWDQHAALPHPYNIVSKRLAELVRQAPIVGVFRTKEHQYSTATSADTHENILWHHFHGKVAKRHHSTVPDAARGDINTRAHVLKRGLEELQVHAFETVLDLIADGSLYRGDEHKKAVSEFLALKRAYDATTNRSTFVWANVDNPAARVRNTAVGTLLIDLSEGLDLDQAVRKFEAVMAPHNYKRPKALVTPKMIDAALEKLRAEGLETAVERRMARISDISVNDILFVDNAVRSSLKDGLKEKLLASASRKPVARKNAIAISADDFVKGILPKAKSVEALIENKHLGNFVTLTAPVHADSKRLFQWDNDFAWSYDGDVADSIRERVKKAGGNIHAPLRVSLSWFNYDDLDLHVTCPDGHICFANKGRILDVDMNVSPSTREAVENLAWTNPRNGRYDVWVNMFMLREHKDVGFEIEIQVNGEISNYRYAHSIPYKADIKVCTFEMRDGQMVNFKTTLPGGGRITDKWGLTTGQLVPVDTIMFSPNHWEENKTKAGNRHVFFMLKGCRNPEAVRGIYNEFLSPKLSEHRKVFELLGAKTKCPSTEDQLSGVGFSAARGDQLTVKVDNRAYTITF